MIIGSLLLLGLFKFPLWNITLIAPQYPAPGLGMDIYINGIEDVKDGDVQNINLMNHYIGMKYIPENDELWHFNVFPKVTISMAILGVLFGILVLLKKGNHRLILSWLILMSILGILGMYNFNEWLIDYGTDLDPKAIMSYKDEFGNPMSYKPPLFGHKKMLNFDVDSYPKLGGYMMFASIGVVFLAYYLGLKNFKKNS